MNNDAKDKLRQGTLDSLTSTFGLGKDQAKAVMEAMDRSPLLQEPIMKVMDHPDLRDEPALAVGMATLAIGAAAVARCLTGAPEDLIRTLVGSFSKMGIAMGQGKLESEFRKHAEKIQSHAGLCSVCLGIGMDNAGVQCPLCHGSGMAVSETESFSS